MVNPCAKRPAAKGTESGHAANDAAMNTVATDFTMGIQSQLREGAIKRSKQIGTRVKGRKVCTQNAIGGGVAFVENLHFRVCVSKTLHTSSQST